MRHIEIDILGQKLVGYELNELEWYVDLHEISDWLDISYDVGKVTLVCNQDYVKYLVPVEVLSRALLCDYLHNPDQDKLDRLEYILDLGLSNLFNVYSIDLVEYLEHCYSL